MPKPSSTASGKVNHLDEVAERDGWRCWLCDEPVDPRMSVNDPRGPSVDTRGSAGKGDRGNAKGGAKGDSGAADRLAHRGCNTRKGAVIAVVPWPATLFVTDPAPLISVAERLSRKGGREVVGRCPTKPDAEDTAAWLIDRFARLVPELPVTATIEAGGGQFMVGLSSPYRR